MNNNDYSTVQALRDKLYATKNENDFNAVVAEIGNFVNGENTMSETDIEKLRNYVRNLREKKKTWWSRVPRGVKENFIFRPEEGQAFINLCNALTAHLSHSPNYVGSVRYYNITKLNTIDDIEKLQMGCLGKYNGYTIMPTFLELDGVIEPDIVGGWRVFKGGQRVLSTEDFDELVSFVQNK